MLREHLELDDGVGVDERGRRCRGGRGRWEWWLTFAGLVTLFAAPAPAFGFHAASSFADSTAKGGGAGLVYIGLPSERGFRCTMCHQKAPGHVRVALTSEPPEIGASFEYQPDAIYSITITMVLDGPELGTQSPIGNFNGLGAAIVDDHGALVGSTSPASNLNSVSGALLSKGLTPGDKAWTFGWKSPSACGVGADGPHCKIGKGKIAGLANLHVAVVDGNAGGRTGGTEVFTDPFGDDALVTVIALRPAGATAQAEPSSASSDLEANLSAHAPPRSPSFVAVVSAAVAASALLAVVARRRRRDRGDHRPRP